MRTSGSKCKKDEERGQVFLSLAPSLKGQLELAVLLGRRSTLSLKDLYKSLPLDSRLPFSLQAKGMVIYQLLLCPELLHYPCRSPIPTSL